MAARHSPSRWARSRATALRRVSRRVGTRQHHGRQRLRPTTAAGPGACRPSERGPGARHTAPQSATATIPSRHPSPPTTSCDGSHAAHKAAYTTRKTHGRPQLAPPTHTSCATPHPTCHIPHATRHTPRDATRIDGGSRCAVTRGAGPASIVRVSAPDDVCEAVRDPGVRGETRREECVVVGHASARDTDACARRRTRPRHAVRLNAAPGTRCTVPRSATAPTLFRHPSPPTTSSE